MEISFSKNLYDQDGDMFEKCIILYFDDTFMLKLKNEKQLKEMIKQLKKIEKEITGAD